MSDVLNACISGTADAGLSARLQPISTDLANAGINYAAQANAQNMHGIARVTAVGAVTAEELKALYSLHLSATRGAARATYDVIRNAAPNSRCTLCGAGTVAALDHHLPKSKYPDLAILPANLVPACHYCNDAKRAKFPRTADQQTLHPYFDGHLQGQWLTASVRPGPPVAVLFSTIPQPQGWSLAEGLRAKRHLAACKLAAKYASNAADELGPVRDRLIPIFNRGGPAAVHLHLAGETQSRAVRLNDWQHAFYQALRDNTWFVAGGFQQIAV